ncbi:TPA: tail fiber assembly protein [Klebsiella quasipneumoniae]
MYYSASENAFYAPELKSIYLAANSWPADAAPVDNAVFIEFSNEPPAGKYRVSGDNGLPSWADIPPPTDDEIKALGEVQKAQLRAEADAEIAWRQDAVDADIATDDESAALSEWKKYRVLLMRVDTANPEWPTPPVSQAN